MESLYPSLIYCALSVSWLHFILYSESQLFSCSAAALSRDSASCPWSFTPVTVPFFDRKASSLLQALICRFSMPRGTPPSFPYPLWDLQDCLERWFTLLRLSQALAEHCCCPTPTPAPVTHFISVARCPQFQWLLHSSPFLLDGLILNSRLLLLSASEKETGDGGSGSRGCRSDKEHGEFNDRTDGPEHSGIFWEVFI